MKRIVFFIFFVSGVLCIPSFIESFTLGFQPAKLHPRLTQHSDWDGPVLTKEIADILNQPFFYLNLGGQSYVFESSDRKYVLKLFRYNRSQFPLIQKIKRWVHQKKARSGFFSKIDLTFKACKIGYFKAPECTQILYIHLNPSEEKLPTISIKGPLSRKWILPLNKYRFLLQKKAKPFKKTLQEVYESKNREEMERMLDSFLALLYKRTGKQIRNSDPNYGPNFGFYEGKAIEIDCGNYRQWPDLLDPEKRIKEMDRFVVQLYVWLIKHAPEYYPYFHSRFTSVYEGIRKGEPLFLDY